METETNEPVPQVEAKRLVRRRGEKKIAGVAAGLADYFEIDVIWVRFGFILGVAAGFLGPIAYVALWFLMPTTDEPSRAITRGPRPGAHARPDRPRLFAIAFVVIGALILTGQLFDSSPGLVLGLVLVGIGAYLFRELDPPAPPGGPRAGSSVDRQEVQGSDDRAAADVRASELGMSDSAPWVEAPVLVPRERSPLGAYTFGAIFVVLGSMWLLDLSGAVSIRLVQYLAAVVALLGVGVFVGTWVGRGRWLVLPALLLLPFVVVASFITVPFEGGIAGKTVRVASEADLRPEYRHAAGEFTLWLADLPVDGWSAPQSVRVTLPVGKVMIVLPRGLPVDVRARTGVGEVEFTVPVGQKQEFFATGGVNVDESTRFGPAGVPAALTIDVQTSLGGVHVWTSSPIGVER